MKQVKNKKFFTAIITVKGIIYAQAFLGLPETETEKNVGTMSGTYLRLGSYKGNNGYVATIREFYFDLDNNKAFVSVSIRESDINMLINELYDVYDYYIKWDSIARKNNVKDVEKEIPVNIFSIKDLGCSAFAWNADRKSVKFSKDSALPDEK